MSPNAHRGNDRALRFLFAATILYGLFGLLAAGLHLVITHEGLKIYPKAKAGFYSVIVDARGSNAEMLPFRHPDLARAMTLRGDGNLLIARSVPQSTRSWWEPPATSRVRRATGVEPSQQAPRNYSTNRPTAVESPRAAAATPSRLPPEVIRALELQGVVLPGGELTGDVLEIALSVDPSNPFSVTRGAAELKLRLGVEAGRQGIRALEELERNPQAWNETTRLIERSSDDLGRLLRGLRREP